MPELGKYASEVLTAYGISLVLLIAIIAQSWLRAGKVRKALEEAEARRADA
ncbi:MAG: heme exporter protein CcmD [Paracoccaceae bacterium]|nr:heme exporter protein CcmD [Paracoccaceae bacterium]